MGKKFYMSKTIIFNALVLIVALANLFGFVDFRPEQGMQEAIDAIVALVTAAIPLVNIVLRLVTKEPIKL